MSNIEAALDDLRQGRMLIVVDDENRENEGDLLMAAESVRPADVNFMARYGRGLICQAITQARARELDLHPMVAANTAALYTAFTISVDAKGITSTGISAADRAATIGAIIDPEVSPDDLLRPGHIFPLIAHDEGVLGRNGHTEAGVDLASMAGMYPSAVICEIMDDDGTMALRPRLEELASAWKLRIISIQDIIAYRQKHAASGKQKHAASGKQKNAASGKAGHIGLGQGNGLQRISESFLPTDYGDFRIIAYRSDCFALVKGDGHPNPLVRIHSECLTGESLGSRRCDCGFQLHTAMSNIEAEGAGIIIYLRQEGRGVGLVNKLKAYALQDEGMDTYDANLALHLPVDDRDYSLAVAVLHDLGVARCRLLTNNPDKMRALDGLEVQRVSIEADATKENQKYLETKKRKFGHLLSLSNSDAKRKTIKRKIGEET